ncbi:oxidoreductase alpha (molybdopterin) subunit [Segniliparus rotundus DSM 44985]|uniref:Oxidoreductase alpha (Molybdopterin) subunit n=1 Tax=Segniliparus rotundus (strain ATCC BAA-972 / CDC 1076 / CIP 108378 / DSM 44985 / JCM 13578) TaxID=640132 RepID=D6Z8P9_SEGRD|nr:FdhF/YdeP family oxidoreductase [Segniliparus rotundus]ADG98329.1 oxidoreductase alpha (molybdopterin) subunit [Segniliparus rotundus DSM 44985]
MRPKARPEEVDEADLAVTAPEDHAAGVKAVMVSMVRALPQMKPARTAKAFARLNQDHGFDCPSCAWPDPQGRRRVAEFCENGAKAVSDEATKAKAGPDFFARHSLADLDGRTNYWLGQQGRLTHPMVARPGATHYEPISWDEAYRLIADELTALHSPNEAVFYTSGRTSNEAAFCYQLFARCFGTNNLPDCSNMCHESSGAALAASIGIGKGSVSLDDVHHADLIIIAGQNPGTNHPRMLTALDKAKSNGARIVAMNPLPEAGLIRFKDPQTVRGVLGNGTKLADHYLRVRLGGDQAVFQGLGKLLVESGSVDRDFIERHTHGFAQYERHVRAVDLAVVEEASGIRETQLREIAALLARSQRTIICWAMGLTQHVHGVATIQDATSVLLLRGMIGKPGAGVCPVRGHSNVQGDRTMGIWEKMPESFLAALDKEFGITSPREHGADVVDSIRLMRDGKAKVFFGMGGNFVQAAPDTDLLEAALRGCSLTVQVSTKLNRAHVVRGKTALILPTLGRTDKDVQAGGKQVVSVEDSMSMVHLSRGNLAPASDQLRSEVAIVCELAARLFGPEHPVPWQSFRDDYDRIRDSISRVVPGFEHFNERVREKDGFLLPHPPRDSREFETATGKANFFANPLEWTPVPEGRLILQTLRSHDQFNTTIYGLSDRYRGVAGGRRVVFVNPEDIHELGLRDGMHVDIVSEWDDGGTQQQRLAPNFRVVAYDTPKGNAAAYYPETNSLLPLDHVAKGSNTPVAKAITVQLKPVGA